MHIHKTGALIRAAVLLGAPAGASSKKPKPPGWIATPRRIGLAFQVVDDVLDADASTATLGKTAGKDSKQGKSTYVSAMGVARARELAEELRGEAHAALAGLGAPARRLRRSRGLHRSEKILGMATITDELPADGGNPTSYELLKTINDPAAAAHARAQAARTQLADELRAYVLESVSKTGGHLSSNLGTVELTIALHYVFDTPEDRIVWDVGHQTYPHKILTGRREGMARLRMLDGISGFPRRSESKYDTFGTAHSSTSISAALGMAVAAKIKKEKRRCIAVIGDGAMSAGMAFEAMNNAGAMDVDLLVILNDNEMSISPPVGALTNYLARLLSGRIYATARARERAPAQARRRLGARAPRRGARQGHGHALDAVRGVRLQLHRSDRRPRPRRADSDAHQHQEAERAAVPAHHHAQGPGLQAGRGRPDRLPRPGQVQSRRGAAEGERRQADLLADLRRLAVRHGERDPRLVAITPAMREGSGMVRFSERFPERYFDVGIAEQHAVTFAAGLACEGLKPVVAIYSTFLQRGYDQLIHDVAIQNLPVLFALDRGGLVGGDGATHNGAFDYAYLRTVPNLTVMAPADENECRDMLFTGFNLSGPVRGALPARRGAGRCRRRRCMRLPVGKGEIRRARKARRHPRLRRDAQARAGSAEKPSMPRWSTCAS